MFTDHLEEQFFLSHINNTHRVLEYGSGESTVQLCKLAQSVVSIEHQIEWFDKINNLITSNCKLILKQPDQSYIEGTDCGSYDQFHSYIHAPIDFGPYDIILIDGRARVECAKICHLLGKPDSFIFVHDFDRKEYQEIKNILNFVEQVHTMAKFKL